MTQLARPNFAAVFTAAQGTLGPLANFGKQLIQELSRQSDSLLAILDKGISLDDNVDCAVASYTSNATPDTEDAVPHALGKVPQHVVVSGLNKGGVVYAGGTPFTNTHVYLKVSVGTAAVKLILL